MMAHFGYPRADPRPGSAAMVAEEQDGPRPRARRYRVTVCGQAVGLYKTLSHAEAVAALPWACCGRCGAPIRQLVAIPGVRRETWRHQGVSR